MNYGKKKEKKGKGSWGCPALLHGDRPQCRPPFIRIIQLHFALIKKSYLYSWNIPLKSGVTPLFKRVISSFIFFYFFYVCLRIYSLRSIIWTKEVFGSCFSQFFFFLTSWVSSSLSLPVNFKQKLFFPFYFFKVLNFLTFYWTWISRYHFLKVWKQQISHHLA